MHYALRCRAHPLLFHILAEFTFGLLEPRRKERTIIDYGFGTLGAEALFAGHHRSNEASRQLLLK
jgi:hypothetical protein